MDVYVVTYGYDYESTSVLGVYSTEQKAQAAVEDMVGNYYDEVKWYTDYMAKEYSSESDSTGRRFEIEQCQLDDQYEDDLFED